MFFYSLLFVSREEFLSVLPAAVNLSPGLNSNPPPAAEGASGSFLRELLALHCTLG